MVDHAVLAFDFSFVVEVFLEFGFVQGAGFDPFEKAQAVADVALDGDPDGCVGGDDVFVGVEGDGVLEGAVWGVGGWWGDVVADVAGVLEVGGAVGDGF